MRGQPRCTTSTLERNPPRDLQRALGLVDGLRPRRRRPGSRATAARPSAGREALADRRVHAVQLEPRFGEPLLQIGDRRRIVVVEMRPCGEELDGFEPVRGDLEQMVAASR